LGGGEWKKSSLGNSFFGCEGGPVLAEIQSGRSSWDKLSYVQFFATGQENAVEDISVFYVAHVSETNQSSEADYRERYAVFLDQVSEEIFGERLSSDLRLKILEMNQITNRTALELTKQFEKGTVEVIYRGAKSPGTVKSVKSIDIQVKFTKNVDKSSNS
jgi:hypothetical protein